MSDKPVEVFGGIKVGEPEKPKNKSLIEIYTRSLPKFDPDAALDKITQNIATKIINIDAKLFEGDPSKRTNWNSSQRKHYPTADAFFGSQTIRRRLREQFSNDEVKDLRERLADPDAFNLKESSDLTDYPDERSSSSGKVFAATDTVLPGVLGPVRQMTLYDVLDAHRKSHEAATRNPIGKRIVKIIPQFVLSRGVRGRHSEPKYQQEWNQFWKRNRMRSRIKTTLRELVEFGEVFLRYFETKDGLVVRSLDPATIWEIVTNPDDIEDVYFYHQQYTTPTQMVMALPKGFTIPSSTLVIRQIGAPDIDHFKINATSFEKRGRSELFAILSWLVRFREFANDRIILGKMRSMFALDVAVDGSPEDVRAANEMFRTPPGSGSVMVHNKKIETNFKNANTNANESKTDAEMILKIIAVGAGISESFLGVSYNQSRAGALINTEPDVKNFEDYREIVEEILEAAANRAFEANNLDEPEMNMEFTFPGIASEDRSAKVKDLALAESMDWFSKERAATMSAKEFDVSNYDFKTETETIRQERDTDPVMAQGMQQVQKIAPDPMELAAVTAAVGDAGQPAPGGKKPGPTAKAKGSGKKAVSQTGAQAGFPADLGGRGLARTKASLARGAFTRANEKMSLKKNRTSQTPRLAEAGWNDDARSKSLQTRRARRAARLLRLAKEAGADVTIKETDADRDGD